MEGVGVAVFIDGSRYKGAFLQGRKHGKGILFYPPMSREMLSSFTSLSDSFLSFSSPFSAPHTSSYIHVYEGEFSSNLKHGTGKELFKSGAVYEGEYREGYRAGTGTYTFPDGSTTYHGEFKQNLFHGFGRLQYPNGNVYEGNFEEGKRHGKGRATFSSTGLVYEGGWEKDLPHAESCEVLMTQVSSTGETCVASYSGFAQYGKVAGQRQLPPRQATL